MIGFVMNSYLQGMQERKEYYNYAANEAKRAADISTVDEFFLYNGRETYYVIVGKTSDGEKKTVWIPKDQEKKIIQKSYSFGKSKEEILKMVQNELKPYEIISIKPGMEKNIPIWEVTYKDRDGKYNYYYFDYKTGEWLKFYKSI